MFGRVHIVENRSSGLEEKKRNIHHLSAVLPDKPISFNEFIRTTDTVFNGANLDFCCHFCMKIVEDLTLLFNRRRLSDEALLFMTVADRTMASMGSDRYYNPKFSRDEINLVVKGLAICGGYELTNLGEDINFSYKSGIYTMHTFGWCVTRK